MLISDWSSDVCSSDLQARATYSKTIRLPDFGSLNPGLSYVVATNPNVQNSGSAGNPDLRPQKSQSFDATLEYYWKSGFVAVAGYYRDITDRVISAPSIEFIHGIGYKHNLPPTEIGRETVRERGCQAG